jgi:hypothetical protein
VAAGYRTGSDSHGVRLLVGWQHLDARCAPAVPVTFAEGHQVTPCGTLKAVAAPFRSENEGAQARIQALEARVAELEQENARLVAGHPPVSRLPRWLPMALVGGLALGVGVAIAIFLSVWQYLAPSPAAPASQKARAVGSTLAR